ncbi:MAG TPA: NAD(P)/FAD-dependent oxidoreductase [Thermohalobaculum sp.]|nr:NAD(P)/FAD-dependent oxidoreductase [Thermohalobaculum sp.]
MAQASGRKRDLTAVAIVGAGPAGIAAAATLVAHGVRPVLIDEAEMPGGQVYRRPPDEIGHDMARLLGSEVAGFRRFHDSANRVVQSVDYRPSTLAWGVQDGALWTATPAGKAERLKFGALILATGATDRVLPAKGWTLPGVFALGGSQAILKGQGCLIGRRVAFCGSSPLLYLAALQHRRMGAEVVAVLDTTPFAAKVAALPNLTAAPGVLLRGLGLMARLRRWGIRIEHGVRLVEFVDDGHGGGVSAIRYRDAAGHPGEVACDAAALGYGLRPESQLAELAGCEFRYDPLFRQWFPVMDAGQRGAPGVYLAGDSSTIGGAEAAAVSGAIAAGSVLRDLGIRNVPDQTPLRRKLNRLLRFQAGLAQAFAWPSDVAGDIPDDVSVCRCEAVTAGELRAALSRPFGADELNRLKAQTRCGMGRCQGRYCELAAGEIAAAALGRDREAMGRLRGQAPVKPIPLSAATDGEA